MADKLTYYTNDLILQVSPTVNPSLWDESKYDDFIQMLTGGTRRRFQQEAIYTTLRYLLGGSYSSLENLAKENYENNRILQAKYPRFEHFVRSLSFPNKLSASIDLATGTGKSYVIYGIAAILLAEGIVDSVLVLCPSVTIEQGLTEKFGALASNQVLAKSLPTNTKVAIPKIGNGTTSFESGEILIENYHSILEETRSSITDALTRGLKVAVLNDEAHHLAVETGKKERRWKQFLDNAQFKIPIVLGFSGTCYKNDEYFPDVICRYSLRDAIESNHVKDISYVRKASKVLRGRDYWEEIYQTHQQLKKELAWHGIIPLSIIVTKDIQSCDAVAGELKDFLVDAEHDYANPLVAPETVDSVVRTVHSRSNRNDRTSLNQLDNDPQVEWVVSVSMLTEGWDVKRVFLIVPHEERAFNSKLLISQVLGRGLRKPEKWEGEQPTVTVLNHHNWTERIDNLVNELLESEKTLTSYPVEESDYHFDLHNIEYDVRTTQTPMTGKMTSDLFSEGLARLHSASIKEEMVRSMQDIRGNEEEFRWTLEHYTYSPEEIANDIYERFEDVQPPERIEFLKKQYPRRMILEIVKSSLASAGMTVATEEIRQTFLRQLHSLSAASTYATVYEISGKDEVKTIGTNQRPKTHCNASRIRVGAEKSVYFGSKTRTRRLLPVEEQEFFDEVVRTRPGREYNYFTVGNDFLFKTPLSLVIADSEPEDTFLNALVDAENVVAIEAWIKSTSNGFYGFEYAWKKVNSYRSGKFNPDFFIKVNPNLISVVEIKDDNQIRDPDDENVGKFLYATLHFREVNRLMSGEVVYKFNFLTPADFYTYFDYLRSGRLALFSSRLDRKLEELVRQTNVI